MRFSWLDTARGVGTLLLFPVIFRLGLQPAGAAAAPAEGPGRAAWWYGVELAGDQTGFWLLAMCAGCAMAAHRRAHDDERVWTALHRARWLLLLPFGLAHAYYLWPASLVPAAAVAAIVIAGAVRDTGCRPIQAAMLAAAVPIAAEAAHIESINRWSAGAEASWDRFAVSTPEYDEWESASYRGSWAEQEEARRAQWITLLSRHGPLRDGWQMGAGMLFGLWWERAGRHRRRRPGAAELVAAGIGVNAIAATMHMTPLEAGLAARFAGMASYAGGALLAAGVLAAATRRETAGARGPLATGLGGIGRRPLTAFALTTLAAAAVGHGWGLGLHGVLTPAETGATALALGAAIAAGLLLLPPDRGGTLERWRARAAGAVVAAAVRGGPAAGKSR